MRIKPKVKTTRRARAHERGAALLMMLLISMLLLAAGGTLIMTSAVSGTNANDATAEKQAYYAAEAGLQETMNAMRGNLAHDAAVANGTQMSLRTAIMPNLSNGVGRSPNNNPCITDTPAAPSPCRLQGWLPYNANGLVPIDANTAFRSTVYDPDQSNMVTYSTSGQFNGLVGIPGSIISPTQLQLGVGPDLITITYLPKASTTINAYPSGNIDLGSFRVDKTTLLAALPLNLGSFVTFRLTVNQTAPWSGTAVYKLTLGTPGALLCPGQLFHISIPQPALKVGGTSFTISTNSLNVGCPGVGAAVTQQVGATIVAPEPRQVVVRSIGFGPNFARKQLEMLVSRADLDFEAPATLTLRGADDCSPMTFNAGNSNAKTYRGADNGAPPEPPRPAIAVQGCDYDDVVNGTPKPGTVSGSNQVGIMGGPPQGGSMSSETVNMPPFLQTADAARNYLNELQAAAIGQGRYFKQAAGTSYASNEGTAANPAFTFVDGDCDLAGGAGMLVVTGNLNMSGNPSYDGIILVLGGGSVNRDGGGNGQVNGAIVVAKFDRTWPSAQDGQPHPFLAPTFNTNGGGTSDIMYNSNSVARALGAIGARVSGVLEY
jgi:hypothetical protein